jgi:hypothetical protein
MDACYDVLCISVGWHVWASVIRRRVACSDQAVLHHTYSTEQFYFYFVLLNMHPQKRRI